MTSAAAALPSDEDRLAELGYKQELNRGWSGFSNFAISLTIICILSGCFTTYGQAWNAGGPVAISIGWPVISVLVLLVGLSMAELASKYPTAGGIYYWAYSLGGVRWAWFTGWFNLLGLVAIIAGVDYGAAAFLNSVLGLYGLHFILNFTTTNASTVLHNTFILFALILLAHSLINVFSSPLVALLNRVSAWWMLGGVVVIVTVLIFGPSSHQSFSWVFGHRANNTGFSGSMYWFFVLPLGFLLTMYTFTGYDASAHLSEETRDAERAAPRGLWRSIAYSAVGGWALLLAITFAATRRRDQQGRRHLSRGRHDRAQHRPREARARHLDGRPAVLRNGLRRRRVAHVLRLLQGRRRARPQSVATVEPAPHADLVGVARGRSRPRDHDPGVVRQQRRPPGRVLCGHVDHHDQPVHRLRSPRCPALADGRQVPAGRVEPRPALPMDQPDRDRLGRPVRGHLLPADVAGGGAMEQGIQLEFLQLRAARHDRPAAWGLDRLGGRCQPHVQGPGQDGG